MTNLVPRSIVLSALILAAACGDNLAPPSPDSQLATSADAAAPPDAPSLPGCSMLTCDRLCCFPGADQCVCSTLAMKAVCRPDGPIDPGLCH